MRTKFGPMKKKELYVYRINELIEDGWFDEWRDTHEICIQVNKRVPVRWAQMHFSAISKYMRRPTVRPTEEKFEGRVRYWKKL